MLRRRTVLLASLVFFLLSYKLSQPFWGHHEFNGVYYGMIAKNYLRYGIVTTRGAQVNNLYPAPPEQWSYHPNHPATYPLFLAFLYRMFGASESVARLFSVTASILGIVFLARLIDVVVGTPYAWLAVLGLVFTPLFRYNGSLPVFEPLLFPVVTLALYTFWVDKKRWWRVFLLSALAILIDWPGFWLPFWLVVCELLSERRRKIILALGASVGLAFLLLGVHQLVTYGSFANWLAVGEYRLGVAAQPFTFSAWTRLLLARSRAFVALPILIASLLGLFFSWKRGKRREFLFLDAVLAIGVSHILVFRNIAWYHDYMLYHLLPFFGLASGWALRWMFMRFGRRGALLLTLLLPLLTFLSTRPFFQALVALSPHKDCVELGYKVRESQTPLRFQLSTEKAKECPPFIGFYGEKPFEVEVEE